MEIGLVVLAAALVVAVVVAVGYSRELKRVAAFLDERDPASNGRLPLGAPLPGTPALVNAVNRQLDSAQALLRRQQQEEREFQQGIASLSHDIRTPLAGARGYVQLAADELAASCKAPVGGARASEGPSSSESPGRDGARFLTLADGRLEAMQGMLDQLFDYTRSLDGDLYGAKEEVNAVALLSSVLAGNYPSFAQRGWQPSIAFEDAVIPVEANSEALRRIFENLVANALRHGSGEFLVRQQGRRITFQNRAEGLPGIDISRVFERFYRGDAPRTAAGAGLGLSVVQNLCRSQGFSATAVVDGSFFAVTLDLS